MRESAAYSLTITNFKTVNGAVAFKIHGGIPASEERKSDRVGRRSLQGEAKASQSLVAETNCILSL